MAETFTFQPTYATSVDVSPRMKSIKFGNGYEQEYPDGINAIQEEWSLTFDRIDSEIIEIKEFFEANYATYFNWNFQRGWGGEKQYKCRKWKASPLSKNISRITATFTEWAGLI